MPVISNKTENQKKNWSVPYRFEVFCRTVVAIGVAYILSLSSTIVFSRSLPGSIEQNLLAMMMLSFAFYSAIVVFVFSRRSFAQACLLPSMLAALMSLLVYFYFPAPTQ